MAATIYRVHGAFPPCAPATSTSKGYATVPRRITRRTDLRIEKIVLDALLGLCWGESRICRASIREIGLACGMPRRTVQRHLDTLAEAGLIDRRPDPEVPGGAWVTYILTDPKGLDEEGTPRQKWRVVAPEVALPRARSGAALLYRQPSLPFFEPPAGSDSASPPEQIPPPAQASEPVTPPPPPARPPIPRSEGPYRGPRAPGVPPPGYRWVYSQGAPREGVRPGLEEIPGYFDPKPTAEDDRKLAALLDDPAWFRRFGPECASPEKTGRGASLQSPPRPAGAQTSLSTCPPIHETTGDGCTCQVVQDSGASGVRNGREAVPPGSIETKCPP